MLLLAIGRGSHSSGTAAFLSLLFALMVAYFEPLVISPRILQGTTADLRLACYRDGQPSSPDSTPTCSVVDADGNAIATPTVTKSEGILTATLTPTDTAQINLLSVTWGNLVYGVAPDDEEPVSVTVQMEVVGDVVFTIAEARAVGVGREKPLQDSNLHTATKILQERDRIADDFGDILGYDLGARYRRDTLDGLGTYAIWLNRHEIRSIRSLETRSSTTWTAVSTDSLNSVLNTTTGRLLWESQCFPRGTQNIRVAYEHGMQPIPLPLKRAALILLQDRLINGEMSSRQTQEVFEGGQFTLATPGRSGAYFGLPAVDEALNRYARKVPGIA